MWKIANLVWEGEGWPEEWKTGLIVPIVKKGEGGKVEDYRGVTLMPVGYKVYAEVVRKRLEEVVERMGLIPHNQTGFREGMGTVDNIYALNFLVNRSIKKEKGKLVAVFVDFKAAFPSVNRGILWKTLRDFGIGQGFIERIKEFYEDTREKVKIGEELGEEFWLGRGLRQGCPLSPILFNLLMADLEEKMERKGKGGVILGKRRVYVLAYADDVVLMAENERGMKLLMKEFEGYVRKKDLCVNVEKTKVVRFRRIGEVEEVEWKLNGRRVEEVNEFCYLGYWFNWNGEQELNIERRIEKGGRVMGQVWGIGERRFKNDWKKRVWLFDALVWAVISYGVEVWGWGEIGKVESLHERFLRWTMGVDRNCPGYMLREELGREKVVLRQRKRAMGLEEKLELGRGSDIARECLRMVKKGKAMRRKDIPRWERERGDALEEGRRWGGNEREVMEGWKKKDENERWSRIVESKYNRWYRMVRGEKEPGYLGKMKKYESWNRLCRFRMGEGVKECRYWMDDEEKMCRMCGFQVEDWKHVLEECMGEIEVGGVEGGIGDKIKWILDENGKGEKWIERLERMREERMY
ncbi:uncharacterized protein LOC122499949 [Leptopilina heterotoma]|uniref:uncharacterized protein LOC122499949 n=1 Tax=Leptopilina heterotoma TaxID=63436 RepID=UPI001CA9765D|nr:uncharacterized protein LOC122499949 [Leptopilina heterotoma]